MLSFGFCFAGQRSDPVDDRRQGEQAGHRRAVTGPGCQRERQGKRKIGGVNVMYKV